MRVLGTTPTTSGRVLGTAQTSTQSSPSPSQGIWNSILDFAQNLPTAPLGNAVSNSVRSIGSDLRGDHATAQQLANENGQNFGKIVGSALYSAATPASFALSAPASIAKTALQFGGLGAATAGGASLAQGNDLGTAAKDAAVGGGINAGLGVGFNLLGKALAKTAPSVASVTSGVPKAAIEQAAAGDAATVKEGVSLPVSEVRSRAVGSLQTLYNDLNSEFASVSKQLPTEPLPNAQELSQRLISRAQEVAQEYKVATQGGLGGLSTDFAKSSIVNPGEEAAVKKALQTVSTWDDYSPAGIQQLSQRIGALAKYDSNGVTKSSALVRQIDHSLSNIIDEHVPVLSEINKNYSSNVKVLNEISDVIGADAKKPAAIQASITRLDNIFKENRDEYLNIVKQLGDRSGIDYLSLLAGGEFQKLLPGYIRSAVAVGSVGGVGAALHNPLSLLLLPLFSPRLVGVAARNAPTIAKTVSQTAQGAASLATPVLTQGTVQ